MSSMVSIPYNLDQFGPDEEKSKALGGCASCGVGELMANAVRCGNGLEKIYPTTAVRYGFMRYIGEFSHAQDMKFTCGAKVIIQTRRGIEVGEQVSLSCSGCEKSVPRDKIKEWVDRCGEDSFIFGAGRILREATAGDLAEHAHIQLDCKDKRHFAQNLADRHKLAIKIVECEHLFGGERIIFYFTAAERVDFRALVKDLAREYRTRIEMRQIGARDEARLLADFETCGREVCCKVFLKTLRPISMRMAKIQKATLDPTQVSGRCGRLKCCLRYEHEGYEELDKKLPKVGTRISTLHGDGVVVNRQILTQLVQIRDENERLVTVVIEDVCPPHGPAQRPDPVESAQPAENNQSAANKRGKRDRAPRRKDRASQSGGGENTDANQTNAEADGSPDGKTSGSGRRGARRRGGRRRGRPRGGGGRDGSSPPPNPPST